MTTQTNLGGVFTFSGASMTTNRMGYGAMQLAGPGVWGPPRDVDMALAVLREAVAAGVNHIDTSDFYGPHVTNQIIKQALHPYPDDLVIVTKVGAYRPDAKSWKPAISREQLTNAVHDNLRNLGLDALDIVNYRVMGSGHGPEERSIAEQVTVLAELKRQGLIRHLGLSNITPKQLTEAQTITEIVCVQNLYNVAQRNDDGFVDDLARQGIAYVPYFPLGGFTATVIGAGCGGGIAAGYAHASRAGVAAATFAQYSIDSRHFVPCASSREPPGGHAATSCRNGR